jgi:hypothetical protein
VLNRLKVIRNSTSIYTFYIRKNVIHSNHIFATIMQLVSKPTYFMTNSMLILCVHLVATCYNCICDYMKGWTKL